MNHVTKFMFVIKNMTKVHILKKIHVTKNAQNVSFGTLVYNKSRGSMPPTPRTVSRF